MIVTLPDHDATIHYLNAWGKRSAESAQEHGITVTMLDRDKATRKNLESYLESLTFNLVFLNGHGKEDMVTGHKDEPLIVAGHNEGKLKSTITYAISCSSASKLGDASVQAGALSYIGYKEDFIFAFDVDDGNATHPLQDKLAGLFLDHTVVLMNTLYKGGTVSEAYKKARNALWESILLVESSGDRNVLSWLLWDYEALVAKGQTDYRL